MELAPVVEEKVPATQLVHEDAALADQVPAAHVKQALIAVLPELALYAPATQFVQVEAPLLDQVPEPQIKQALAVVLPVFELYVPAAQARSPVPEPHQVPGLQVRHFE